MTSSCPKKKNSPKKLTHKIKPLVRVAFLLLLCTFFARGETSGEGLLKGAFIIFIVAAGVRQMIFFSVAGYVNGVRAVGRLLGGLVTVILNGAPAVAPGGGQIII